jgi:DNA-directed RNA polymerase subunit RPC12/RpoP
MNNYDKINRAKYFYRTIFLECLFATRKVKIKSEKNMFKKFIKMNKKLDNPYVILSSYGSIIDPMIMQRNLHYRPIYHVFNSNNGSIKYSILQHMGRRFFNLSNEKVIRAIKIAIKKKINVVIYPEKYPSFDGTTSPISRNIVEIIKSIDKPVMVCINHGTYIYEPMWRKSANKAVVVSELKELFTLDEVRNLDDEMLYNRVKEALTYNECAWAKKEDMACTDKLRCEGVESILYKCPACLEENKMLSKGRKIHCLSCGKQWFMTEYGDMIATLDENENATMHNWFNFQKLCINENIDKREYNVALKVKVSVIPKDSYNKYEKRQPNTSIGVMWHSADGIVLKYNLGNKEEDIIIGQDKINDVYNGDLNVLKYYVSNDKLSSKQEEYDSMLRESVLEDDIKSVLGNILDMYREDDGVRLVLID